MSMLGTFDCYCMVVIIAIISIIKFGFLVIIFLKTIH